jgi:NADH-quinone oxidoreductase subunit N
MLAYSGIAQAGFMLAPFVASQYGGIDAIVIYLVLYAATNLGAFAVVMAIARRTRSAEISSFGGLFAYSPGLAVALSVFLASFVGIPPLGIWYGKLSVMRALIESQGRWATVLAIFVALNTAIAAYYYLNVAKTMWFDDAPEGETTPIKVPTSLRFAVGIALVATIALGVAPGPLTDAATPDATPAAAPSGR